MAKGLEACRLQVRMSCAVLCQIVSLQYLSRSSLHRLAGLPCHMVSNFPTGDTQGPSVVFEAVDVICSGPLKFSYKYDDFCPLPDRDVGPSAHECDVDISFHFDLACISSYRCETDNNCNTSLLKCRRTLNWMLLRLLHKQSYKLSYSHYTRIEVNHSGSTKAISTPEGLVIQTLNRAGLDIVSTRSQMRLKF